MVENVDEDWGPPGAISIHYPIITRSNCLYYTKQNKSSVCAALLAGVGSGGVAPLAQLALPGWWWAKILGPGLAWGCTWDGLPPWGNWPPPRPVGWSRCAPLGVVWFRPPPWHLSRPVWARFRHLGARGDHESDLSTLQYKSAKMPLKRTPPRTSPIVWGANSEPTRRQPKIINRTEQTKTAIVV